MSSKLKRILLVIGASMLLPIVPFVIVGELPGEQWLAGSDQHALGFGLTGALLLAADLVLPVPSSIVGTLLGARLGAPLGTLFSFAGLTLASLGGYGLGRLMPARFGGGVGQAPSAVAVFLSRPVPVFAEALAVAAGALRVPLRSYIAASVAGNALYAAVLAANGAYQVAGALVGPGLVLPMLLPVAAYLLWHRVSARRAN